MVAKLILSVLLMSWLASFIPSYAQSVDEECEKFCKDNGYEDGHYLPQEPGSECTEGYTQHPDNQICCCK